MQVHLVHLQKMTAAALERNTYSAFSFASLLYQYVGRSGILGAQQPIKPAQVAISYKWL